MDGRSTELRAGFHVPPGGPEPGGHGPDGCAWRYKRGSWKPWKPALRGLGVDSECSYRSTADALIHTFAWNPHWSG